MVFQNVSQHRHMICLNPCKGDVDGVRKYKRGEGGETKTKQKKTKQPGLLIRRAGRERGTNTGRAGEKEG